MASQLRYKSQKSGHRFKGPQVLLECFSTACVAFLVENQGLHICLIPLNPLVPDPFQIAQGQHLAL
jgi:hypothetical protein